MTSGAVDGLSIGFRTVKGRIDPATRVRRIVDLELWEISIVTFPLLAGARVRAVKGSVSSPPQLSHARAHAEQEWERVRGTSALARTPQRGAIDLGLRRVRQKYSPHQPRVPAGSHEGGQWINGGGGPVDNDRPLDQDRGPPLTTARDQAPRTDLPRLEALANDPLIRSRIDEAWAASNPNSMRPQEHGFWISRNESTGEVFTRPFENPGSGARITPGAMPNDAIAFFHTHPNRPEFRFRSGPSIGDEIFATDVGLPGLIQSHNGMYYFGPSLRPSRKR